MPHLSELHGAATHLAVIALPLYAVVLLAGLRWRAQPVLVAIRPWVAGAAALGVAAAGATGLLVWGQAQTTLRGDAFRIGTAHFWLGIALAVLCAALVALAWSARNGGGTVRAGAVAVAVAAAGGVLVQGYLGGRMTYDEGVGVDRGGQLAQTARGVAALDVALARGVAPATAGRAAFSAQGLGCARCHGDLAGGRRGPDLRGGRSLEDFRRVHGHGLFPPGVVSARDFGAVVAYLRTLGPPRD